MAFDRYYVPIFLRPLFGKARERKREKKEENVKKVKKTSMLFFPFCHIRPFFSTIQYILPTQKNSLDFYQLVHNALAAAIELRIQPVGIVVVIYSPPGSNFRIISSSFATVNGHSTWGKSLLKMKKNSNQNVRECINSNNVLHLTFKT